MRVSEKGRERSYLHACVLAHYHTTWHRNIHASFRTLGTGIYKYPLRHFAQQYACIHQNIRHHNTHLSICNFLHGNAHAYIRPPGTEICEIYPSEHLVSECTCIHQPPSTCTLLCHTYIPIPSVLKGIFHIFLCLYTSTAWHRHVHVYIRPPWHRSVHVWGGCD